MELHAAVAALDEAKIDFVRAIQGVPSEALSFRKPEDDYSLGGLIAHNVGVVQHYRLVLLALVEGGFAPVRPEDPPGFWEQVADRAKSALPADGLPEALGELEREHASFARELSASGDDFERKGDVFYGSDEVPTPTSPEDILGWVRDHYREHVPHVHELAEAWRLRSSR